MERTPCYGSCQVYTIRLSADGGVEYRGQANVRRVGRHRGRLEPYVFQKLAELAVDIGLFDLSDEYDCLVTDNPTAYVSVTRNGVRKTIRHYAPTATGPARLRAFEETLDRYAGEIEW